MKKLLLLVLALAPSPASAQVLITEIQYDPTVLNDDGEWIELQNTGMAAVAIDGWTLNDYTGTGTTAEVGTRWTFPSGVTLAPGQVIVVAKFASAAGYAGNTPANLYATPASFELASTANDDPNVPNLAPAGGTQLMQLANGGTGDAIVLRDALGAVASAVEWGSVDRSVAGTPAPTVAQGQSLRRIAATGNSVVDFEAAATPDPFTGFVIAGGQPPVIANTVLAPRHVRHGDTLVVTATVADADGVASVELLSTIATSSAGAASTGYLPVAMTPGLGTSYSAAIDPSPGAEPASFHDRYVRVFVRATDTTADTATDPAAAITAAANTAYHWRNVMPSTAAPIADVRAQDAAGTLAWRYHSATIEGVVLARRIAFVASRTNFFVMSQSSNDAIRVFSNVLIPEDVMPGDLVRVTGMIDTFNGLRQLGEPDVEVEVLGSGPPIAPTTHTIAALATNGEQLESQLVHIAGAELVTAIATWPNNGNVDITDGTGTITLRVSSVTDIAGTAAPAGQFDVIGILGQFAANNQGGYQVLPRDLTDILPATPRPDAGPLPDTGTVDSGMSLDAEPGDTGGNADAAPLPDTGTDAGTPKADTGTQPGGDASTIDDAAVARPDTGTSGGGGGGRREDEGCSCATHEDHRGASVLALLSIAALFGLRRRGARGARSSRPRGAARA